jgi:hypothetical protein
MPQSDRGWAEAAIGFCALLSARSLRKHLLDYPEDFRQCRGSEPAQTMHQTLAIYRANLVENNVSRSFPKPAWNSKRVRMASCRQRSDNERPQIRVELVRRDDNTRASLAHFATPRRAETNQEHLSPTNRIPGHHFHCPSSNRVEVGGSSRPSSSRFRIRWAASAHPDRARATRAITIAPSRTRSSTASVSPASSIKGLGNRTPRELPTRIKWVFITTPP